MKVDGVCGAHLIYFFSVTYIVIEYSICEFESLIIDPKHVCSIV